MSKEFYGFDNKDFQIAEQEIATIEKQIAELKAAGWTPLSPRCWKAPAGSGCAGVFLGPHGAWKAMKRAERKP